MKLLPIGTIIKSEYGYIYKRVEGTVGEHSAFVEIKDGVESKKRTGLQDSLEYDIMKPRTETPEYVSIFHLHLFN